ncbi:MAG: O-antigen ligase C-terminal domain-containing protein [Luteimonas sp.]|nr:O-antigen ligase C-terminal domain-containing protein [Luteimonas sp.]
MFAFPAEAPLVSLYLLGFALTLVVARRAEQIAPGRLVDAAFGGLAIASLLSTGLALCQWLSIDTVGVLLAPNPIGARPVANVGQANNLATLLVWGLVAIWWGFFRRRIGGFGATLAAAFLLIGIVLTQSRTGLLEVAILAIAAYVGRAVFRTAANAHVWIGLALWLLICIVAVDPVSRLLVGGGARSLMDAASPNERLALLKMVLGAIEMRPWAGYGWNQTVTAHVALAETFPMHGTVGHAHNAILDLILWNGIPLALLMVAGLAVWFRHAAGGKLTGERSLLLLGLATFSLHAMLELPHVFACFLLPVAVMMGTLAADRPSSLVLRVPRLAAASLILFFAFALLTIFNEYMRIEANATSARLRAARIGVPRAEVDPGAVALQSLQEALFTLRTEPLIGMTGEQLDRLRRTITRYPTAPGLFRYAQATALNGSPHESIRALRVLCALHQPAVCRDAWQGWNEWTLAITDKVRVPAFPADLGSTTAP